jgi:hypothetical protein
LRRRASAEAGGHVISQEYAVLDRVGRLQLPHAYVEALGLERRVRLELEADHIGVWPDHSRYASPDKGGHSLPDESASTPTDHSRYARPIPAPDQEDGSES